MVSWTTRSPVTSCYSMRTKRTVFVRDWRPAVMGPGKHLSYAVQWFGLAIALIVIFIVNLKRNTQDDS